MELNLGSTYNPTGDPLFYMPYWMRITEMTAGNSERTSQCNALEHVRQNGTWNSTKIVKRDKGGKELCRFRSMLKAAADAGVSDTTLRRRMKNGDAIDGFFYSVV